MNIADQNLASEATREFIDELARLLAPWGVPATAGRLYAYLMLRDNAVSLDEIAADLDMSKAGAWNAARFLEQTGNVRKTTERGSKRVFYQRSTDRAPCQFQQMRAMGAIGRLLRDSAAKVGGAEHQARLERIGAFCTGLEQVIDDYYAQYHSIQDEGGPPPKT